MPTPTNQEKLAASQRLLDFIAGERSASSAPAPSNEATSESSAPAVGHTSADGDTKKDRNPLKSLTKAFSHRSVATIGLVYDNDGIFISRTHNLLLGEPYLEGLYFAPYPAGTDASDLDQRVECAVRALRTFVPDYAKCKIWAMLLKCEVCILSLPDAKEEERDGIALLKASQQAKFDPADIVFDYRLTTSSKAAKGTALKALGLVGSKATVDHLVESFRRFNVELAGVTSTKFAAATLLSPAFGPMPWKNFATLHISDDLSILSLLSDGEIRQQRTINYGRSLFLSKVTEKLALREAHQNITTDSGRARLLHAASALLANPMPTDEERQLLEESLSESIHRMVSYIARTVNYYQRVEKGKPLEGIIVTASHGVEQALHAEVERTLGIPSIAYEFPAARSEAAEVGMRNIAGLFKSSAMVSAISMGFADESIPNLLATPEVRRAQRRFHLVQNAVAATVGVISATLVAAGLYLAWGWWSAVKDASVLKRQLAAVTKPITPAMLKSETAKLAALEKDGAELLKKRRFAALMAEIAAIKGDDIFITSMTLTDAAASGTSRGSSHNSRSLAQAAGLRVLTISALLYQTPAERETALANFLSRLEAGVKQATITVRREENKGSGFPVVIRMEGSF